MTASEIAKLNLMLADAISKPHDQRFDCQQLCLHDLAYDGAGLLMKTVLDFASILKALEGKTIKSVTWVNELSRDKNPDGDRGFYRITYTP